jgi:hypothetical protein
MKAYGKYKIRAPAQSLTPLSTGKPYWTKGIEAPEEKWLREGRGFHQHEAAWGKEVI